MLKVAIYHKNRRFVSVIKEMLYNTNVRGHIFVFSYYNIEHIMMDFLSTKSVDVLIVDVDLAMARDQEVLELFRKRLPECVLVLSSADGMINADLLKVKPYRCLYERDISAKNILAVKDVVNYAYVSKKKTFVWGYVGKVAYKLDPDDIVFVSIAKRGSVIHINPDSATGEIALEMRSNAKLSELFDTVGCCGFAYAHNSYFINLQYVVRHSSTEVELEDGSVLSISRSKGKDFDDAFRDYWEPCLN